MKSASPKLPTPWRFPFVRVSEEEFVVAYYLP
jgi:hypothetical protein